ncbi:MAG: WbuC family cupin fold metalloprotein [Stenotrophobium sp.]
MTLRSISRELLAELAGKADASPRLRTNFNFHENADAMVQRLIIQLRRGTYIRPHRHYELNKWEMTLALSGKVDIVLFEDDGRVRERIQLSTDGATLALELPPETWHSYVPLTEHASFFEVKEGPYDASRMTQFADWAPPEGDAEVGRYLHWLETAQAGAVYE